MKKKFIIFSHFIKSLIFLLIKLLDCVEIKKLTIELEIKKYSFIKNVNSTIKMRNGTIQFLHIHINKIDFLITITSIINIQYFIFKLSLLIINNSYLLCIVYLTIINK